MLNQWNTLLSVPFVLHVTERLEIARIRKELDELEKGVMIPPDHLTCKQKLSSKVP